MRIECCSAMIAAQETGTDNESRGALLYRWAGLWSIGYGLPSLKYCPWCRKKIIT